jgi:hypothetical protein
VAQLVSREERAALKCDERVLYLLKQRLRGAWQITE